MPKIYKYDPSPGYLRTAYDGLFVSRVRVYTVVMYVLRRFTFWFFLALHLTVYVLNQRGILKGELAKNITVKWKFIKIITALTSFLSVTYANQCFSQYNLFYENVKQVFGSVHEFILEFRLHCSPVSESSVTVVVRYLLVMLLLFFHDLRGYQLTENDLQKLSDCGLLRLNEAEFLQSEDWSPRQMTLILLHWCAVLSQMGFQKGNSGTPVVTPEQALRDMIDDLLTLIRHLASVRDDWQMQVPYPYFHLLNLLMVVNLCLWAVFLGVQESCMSPVVFVAASFIFLGLMELSEQLSNPFGNDDADFPLEEWMSEFSLELIKISEYTQEDDSATWVPALQANEHNFELGTAKDMLSSQEDRYHPSSGRPHQYEPLLSIETSAVELYR